MANSLPRLYLDTSVPSAYHNERQRERQLLTQRIWHEKLPDYHLVISNITMREIDATRNLKKRKKLARFVKGIELYVLTPAAKVLADEYLKSVTMTGNDALHAAGATISGCEFLLSWNFTHLANDRSRQKINEINSIHDYKTITIISPYGL